ncbi:MAG: hypothetical protein KatS3mg076_1043 [Candidatus Binatia bacterium]|nr:MAG: hypothetical protein KatS3mg076_1043 [Candidatus Binatia bacterium]
MQQKAVNAIRVSLLELLGVPSLYELDRLHLTAHSTIDVALQEELAEFLRKFRDPEFVKAHGLDAKHLLEGADPREVVYSILLYEATPRGNLLRAQADNLDRPFDVNDGIKMELGSTAKLRTLAHYLEIMAELHTHLSRLDPISLREKRRTARDRLTRWAAEYLEVHPNALLREFLDAALERRYSASPYESFFTGGGVHAFRNFDRDDNRRILSVRQAFLKSTNLVFIRLMRDLVAYHKARLPYDAEAVLRDPSNPLRRKMLDDIVEEESRETLRRFYVRYRDLEGDAVVEKLLRGRIDGRSTAVLFHAWRLGEHGWTLDRWFDRWKVRPTPRERRAFETTYARFTLADYGYLLGRHPLEVWVAGERYTRGHVEWKELLLRSARARREAYAWIYKTRNRSAQNRRLRTKIEGDAFERMTPYWRRLGFPFRRLVPSYATAIGSSSDRPSGLAELMGIIVNDGSRKPSLRLTRLRFAEGTPYETVLEPVRRSERVLHPTVARVLREMLRDVVEAGTARRLAGALRTADGITVPLGGKTGSGDNRLKKVNRWGGEIRSRALNRTAAFVFYAGDRYFGVVTAFVEGKKAERYSFTSALPVTVLKLASPILAKHLDLAAPRPGRETENEAKGSARAEEDRGASLPFRPSSGT